MRGLHDSAAITRHDRPRPATAEGTGGDLEDDRSLVTLELGQIKHSCDTIYDLCVMIRIPEHIHSRPVFVNETTQNVIKHHIRWQTAFINLIWRKFS